LSLTGEREDKYDQQWFMLSINDAARFVRSRSTSRNA
jgi:hypothetical protein